MLAVIISKYVLLHSIRTSWDWPRFLYSRTTFRTRTRYNAQHQRQLIDLPRVYVSISMLQQAFERKAWHPLTRVNECHVISRSDCPCLAQLLFETLHTNSLRRNQKTLADHTSTAESPFWSARNERAQKWGIAAKLELGRGVCILDSVIEIDIWLWTKTPLSAKLICFIHNRFTATSRT